MIKYLVDKYEREIEKLDEDMRDNRDNGYKAGKQAALIKVVDDLKEIVAQEDKPWCVEIAEKEENHD